MLKGYLYYSERCYTGSCPVTTLEYNWVIIIKGEFILGLRRKVVCEYKCEFRYMDVFRCNDVQLYMDVQITRMYKIEG